MFFTSKNNTWRWLIILTAFGTLVLILWNTFTFFQTFKNEERLKMEIWATASQTLNKADLNDTDLALPLQILNTNNTIPIIQTTDKDSIINMVNVEEQIARDPKKTAVFFNKLKSQNAPIVIEFDKTKQYLYYGNSSLLTKLKYYPGALILIFIFFTAMIFSFYRASKMATQNRLWAGMAKETAHQIGTPLSSLLGWVEIMRLDEVNEETVVEIEKDVHRLQTIAERFSKIGSKPVLELCDVVTETQMAFDYLRSRVSKQIMFSFKAPSYALMIPMNSILHSWTIENLIKNAIDAMKGKGAIDIIIDDNDKGIRIQIKDTGKGIAKNQFKRIFEPGYTTKKRGWGLGLSLTKRIVETYHNGSIKVTHSELGKGTTICIVYKK
ncbi:PAS domain-containing sensor histidine kinase [Flavobacterium sp. NKUCC04_CG]|uniref:sensor histidine kinase n=1 Tax=Flavobacterium sp. NKUCC04_CG TaxID=2842121 RepID=UPI001C5BD3F3|nr:HAMP domain-containing sensor histidine kinase [Flavobacterium sp. NKUCC04_CG]MBW3517840.1 HAMP domain-containing histidine kinase [Flavobacterium sp. NKUCC04_CG]